MASTMRRVVLLSIIGFALASSATACLWDYDTLAMERARFPGALELICGKFARHSPDFYRWRVQDRLAKIAEKSSPQDLNDLAVAYDKLGEHDQAIASALECERLHTRSYETAANLGTFHIHAGRLEEGLKHIDAALALNPDAHFGRERYQKWLIEYLLTKREAETMVLPLEPEWPEEDFHWHRYRGFALYLIKRFSPDVLSPDDPLGGDSREEASELLLDGVAGVLGMMRFGQHDSPVLLEALGDLLVASHRKIDGKRLAARAYLRASYTCNGEKAASAYRLLAEKCLEIHVDHDQPGMPPELTLDVVEGRFQEELRDAEEWYDELEAREIEWISAGVDVDAEFSRVYYGEDVVVKSPRPWTYGGIQNWRFGWAAVALLSGSAAISYAIRRTRMSVARTDRPAS